MTQKEKNKADCEAFEVMLVLSVTFVAFVITIWLALEIGGF